MTREVNVRFNVPEETHNRVLKIQGLFSFKESKKVHVQDTYIRLVERGIAEIMKHNRV